MAVEHPDPRVVGFEGDVPSLARRDQYRIQVDRRAREAVAIFGKDREDVAMNVDRMELRAVVDNVEANEIEVSLSSCNDRVQACGEALVQGPRPDVPGDT